MRLGVIFIKCYTYTPSAVQLRNFFRKITVILYEWNHLLLHHILEFDLVYSVLLVFTL